MVLQVSCSSKVPSLLALLVSISWQRSGLGPLFGWCMEGFEFCFQADLSPNTSFGFSYLPSVQCCVQCRLISLGLGLFTCKMKTVRAPTYLVDHCGELNEVICARV